MRGGREVGVGRQGTGSVFQSLIFPLVSWGCVVKHTVVSSASVVVKHTVVLGECFPIAPASFGEFGCSLNP